ncbi:telomere stability and silencing-domain-containing protein [Pavlovales sp. CCMP2436]|nr:telomere stability and silencing-domain-containing protein [Pavlovales sp. CCMP2436]|mmetsp:Transcript_26300/g.66762  ORF Transcript_26300/g.66762 Transcript_26300/m.66762 type:complete len:259 (-) Transcript_26300:219-995(-)
MSMLAVLVGRLDGTTLCLRSDGPTMAVRTLMDAIHDAEGIPPETQRLCLGSRDLRPHEVLTGPVPRVTLCLRVEGGKGGFGANLRSKALAAGQKKTSNFDACRDLNGVRLKAVNQERQVSDWRAQQTAKHAAKLDAPPPPPPPTETPTAAFDIDSYYEANESARTGTASAVSAGLAAKRQRETLDEALAEARALEACEAAGGAGGSADAPAGTTGAAAERPGKVPRVDAPASAPSAGRGVSAKWSTLGDEPSDDSSEG